MIFLVDDDHYNLFLPWVTGAITFGRPPLHAVIRITTVESASFGYDRLPGARRAGILATKTANIVGPRG